MAEPSLLFYLASAWAAALIGAMIASALRQSVVVGYLLAGIIIGPFTPGFIAEAAVIQSLAEIGIVFLMFTIGVQLPLGKLLREGKGALAAAVGQTALMTTLAWGAGLALGLGGGEALVFGGVVSISSSTVFSKVLAERGELDTSHARLGLTWGAIQDLVATAMLAVLPWMSMQPMDSGAVFRDLGKGLLFLGVLLPLTIIIMPRLLNRLQRRGSREIFVLAVAALAVTMAYTASRLGISVALGAFLAGAAVGQSDVSHHVAGEIAPLRDVFSGLFFVSIGILIDPWFILKEWPLVLVAVVLIVPVKGAVSAVLARWTRHPLRLSVLVGAALAQSGEFSFLLAQAGLQYGIVSRLGFNLMLAGAVISVLLSPAVYKATPFALRWWSGRRPPRAPEAGEEPPPGGLSGHAVICGYGRVGRVVAEVLGFQRVPFVVIEEDLTIALELRRRGGTVLVGDASQPDLLRRAGITAAKVVLICVPEKMAARRIVDYARRANPAVRMVARTHSVEDGQRLERLGVTDAVLGESQLALEMGRRALGGFGVPLAEVELALTEVRRTHALMGGP